MKNPAKLIFALVGIPIILAVGYDLSRAALKAQAPVPTGAKAKEISGTDLKGQKWSLHERLGKGPVMVNFFATWCGPCRMEMPELVKLQEKYRASGFQIVAISDEAPEILKGDAEVSRLPFVILPNSGDASLTYGVTSIPRTFFFDRSGTLRKDILGYDPEALKEIDGMLAEDSKSAPKSASAALP